VLAQIFLYHSPANTQRRYYSFSSSAGAKARWRALSVLGMSPRLILDFLIQPYLSHGLTLGAAKN
jgi:ABC-type maltose transport system permease subunit